jgi:hypothetical protein
MTSSSTSAAFTRKRAFRIGAGAASAGVLGAFSLVGATPAMAATDADCNATNTFTAGTDPASDIQTSLDGGAELVCLAGTYVLDATLIYYEDVTIHGLPGATLDGDGDTQILRWETFEQAPIPYLTVENLRFTGGSAIEGGAIEAYGVTVINSTFDDNDADFGGGIWAYTADITDSTFTDNEAYFGGAVFTQYGATVYGTTFDQNIGNEDGGAIASYGVVDVVNSTFFENTNDGPGAAIATGGGSIVQSTFLNNDGGGESDGQAVVLYNSEEDLDLRGNIFATDSPLYSLVADFSDGGSINDLGGNVFSTAAVLENDFTASPSTQFEKSQAALFGPNTLANNGGLTETVALIGSSPAINAVPVGEPSVTVDQRGTARDALSDSGAYEYVPALADTGSTPNGWIAGIAGGLLAAGAAALVVTRRRFSNR